ncbi:MAG: flagellar hook-associated protein FlgK [Limnochordales bacterium]|nr:flagellar hook-associated protein FlgK [Limnochordales bacterium]
MSLLNSLEVAKRALNKQALVLETIAENLAHADDPHFSRRRVISSSSSAPAAAGGLLTRQGPLTEGGPAVQALVRERDKFVESRLRGAISESEEALVAERAWQSLEALFDEPGGPASFSELWNNWVNALQDFTGYPDDLGVRQVVLDRSAELAAGIRRLAQGVAQVQVSQEEVIEQEVDRANALLEEIARLNGAIRQAESGLGPRGERRLANGLRDQRDALLRELAGLVNITVREDGNASYPGESAGLRVEIGGTVVVDGEQVLYRVEWQESSGSQPPRLFLCSTRTSPGHEVNVEWPAGALRGRLEMWNTGAELMTHLDRLAKALIDDTSSILTKGVDLYGSPGQPLFVGTDAGDIRINDAWKDAQGRYDPRRLPAAMPPNDNAVARDLLNWARSGASAGGVADHPLTVYQGTLIPRLAEGARQAEERQEAAGARRQHWENLRQSRVGVSPDEEMVTLLATERAYQAAAQLVRSLDEALGTIIDLLGGAGR